MARAAPCRRCRRPPTGAPVVSRPGAKCRGWANRRAVPQGGPPSRPARQRPRTRWRPARHRLRGRVAIPRPLTERSGPTADQAHSRRTRPTDRAPPRSVHPYLRRVLAAGARRRGRGTQLNAASPGQSAGAIRGCRRRTRRGWAGRRRREKSRPPHLAYRIPHARRPGLPG